MQPSALCAVRPQRPQHPAFTDPKGFYGVLCRPAPDGAGEQDQFGWRSLTLIPRSWVGVANQAHSTHANNCLLHATNCSLSFDSAKLLWS